MTEIDTTHTDLRRLRVASLYLRGLTPMEITTALMRNGLRDPVSQLPYSVQVIHHDVLHLEEEWEADMKRTQAVRKARILAELNEARRAAWAKQDLSLVVRCLRQEAALLATEPVVDDEADDIELFRLG